MATKTKIVKLFDGAKITVVSQKESKFAYGFRRTGKTTVAVATAICVEEDTFKHPTARKLIQERFEVGATANLRIAEAANGEEIADQVDAAMLYGNVGYFGQ